MPREQEPQPRRWIVNRVGGRGEIGTVELREVQADGKVMGIDPSESLQAYNHSPDGFECGYGGSGPAQLALAILLRFFVGELEATMKAVAFHQQFKDEFVASAPRDGFECTEGEILGWLDQREPRDTVAQEHLSG